MATYRRDFTLVGTPAQTGQAANLTATLLDYSNNTLGTLTSPVEDPAGSGCYRVDCLAFDPTWMGRIKWLFTGGAYAGRATFEDFGTAGGPHALEGQLVFAQGPNGPTTQPAIYAHAAIGIGMLGPGGQHSGESPNSTQVDFYGPYAPTQDAAHTILQITIDQSGNRTAVTVPNLPS